VRFIQKMVFWIAVGPFYAGCAVAQWFCRCLHSELTDAEWKERCDNDY
jgi:hypothetical protein